MNNYVQWLCAPNPSSSTLWVCCGCLLCLSSSIAWLVLQQARPHIGAHKALPFFVFLLILQTFIPLLGQVIAITSIAWLRRYRAEVYPCEILSFQNPMYIRTTPIAVTAYAEGWASLRLNFAAFPEHERKQALISLSRGAKQYSNLLYQQLVADDLEELRICAFSLLENQQDFIHDKINELLKIYNQTPPSAIQAFYAKQIAWLFWELIYLNLGDKDFRLVILERSLHYANIALAWSPQDPTLLILSARIAMAQQQTTASVQLLQKAAQLHAPHSKIAPYMAEQAFYEHDFAKVRQYLAHDAAFQHILKLRDVVNFWCTHDNIPV